MQMLLLSASAAVLPLACTCTYPATTAATAPVVAAAAEAAATYILLPWWLKLQRLLLPAAAVLPLACMYPAATANRTRATCSCRCLLLPAPAVLPLTCTMRIWSSSGSCLSAPCTPMPPFWLLPPAAVPPCPLGVPSTGCCCSSGMAPASMPAPKEADREDWRAGVACRRSSVGWRGGGALLVAGPSPLVGCCWVCVVAAAVGPQVWGGMEGAAGPSRSCHGACDSKACM
jgi:hypothetical protein